MHIMIDLETLGVDADAPVISIGAVPFDPVRNVVTQSDLYAQIDISSALQHGRLRGETLKWWMKQGDDARAHAMAGTGSLEDALRLLADFYRSQGGVEVWGNGATFDITILEHAYKGVGLKEPWTYKDVRDCRTVASMAFLMGWKFPPRPAWMVSHNAFDDALFQAQWICSAYEALGLVSHDEKDFE